MNINVKSVNRWEYTAKARTSLLLHAVKWVYLSPVCRSAKHSGPVVLLVGCGSGDRRAGSGSGGDAGLPEDER